MLKNFRLILLALAAFGICLPAVQAQAAKVHTLNKVAAVVNGEMISMFDVQRYSMPEITRLGFTGNDAQSEAGRQRIFQTVLDGLIMDILIRQEAERFKVTVSDAEVDNELRMIMQRNQMTPKQFEDQLVIQGSSLKQAKEQISQSMLRQRMMTVMVARKIIVTKEEVERYYEAHKSEFTTQHAVDVSMLLFFPAADVNAIRKEIVSGKTSFADAVRNYSSAPNAASGGSMGSIPWKDLNPEWRQVLANMKPGEVSEVMQSGNARYLLQLNTAIEDSSRTLEEVYAEIEDLLRAPKLDERFEEYSEQLRKNAVVEIRM